MFIDYIYLLLILTLICSILFLIYLSYEYRINEGFLDISSNSIPTSINPIFKPINPIPTLNIDSMYSLVDDISPNSNDYDIFINKINNSIHNKKNLANAQLLIYAQQNLDHSKNLENLKIGNKENNINTFPINELIKTIKSRYNSQYLSTFANDTANYGILVNDKCLTVNGLCKEDFCLLDCQNNLYVSPSQKFSTKRIYSNIDAAKIMNVPEYKISSTNVYPFNIFKSTVNDKCLTINSNGITVEKCNLNKINQQWEISPDENICILK
jgi:hypothetical protein